MRLNRRKVAGVFAVSIVWCFSVASSSTSANAQAIPYSTPGVPITSSLPLFAQQSGEVLAYFAGSYAVYESILGLNVNGVGTGRTGLDTKTSAIGSYIDLGYAQIGASLTPYINVLNTGLTFSPDPSLNSDAISHAYLASFAGGVLNGGTFSFPAGEYIGFEDLSKFDFANSDFDYNDAVFILTNAGTTRPTVLGTPGPVAGAGVVPLFGLAGMWFARRRRKQPAA